MKVLHGTWIPSSETSFIQTGAFYLWIETLFQKRKKTQSENLHSGHLRKEDLSNFLVKELGIPENPTTLIKKIFPQNTSFYLALITNLSPL